MMGCDYVAHYNFLFKTIHFKLLTVSATRKVVSKMNCLADHLPAYYEL